MDHADDRPVLDWDAAVAELGSESMAREIAIIFIDECGDLVERVRTAIAQGDHQSLHLAAHTLKGSGRVFAAERLADAAWQLEQMGNNKTLAGAETALRDLEAEAHAVVQALRKRVTG